MNMIGQYRQTSEFTNENAGTAEWCSAERDGKLYFVKKFLSPVYPSADLHLPEKKYKARVARFHKILNARIALYQNLRAHDSAGVLVLPVEVINYQYHICAISEFVTGNTRPENVCRLSEWQRVIIMRTLTLALMDVHSAGIIHGDLRPDNVLITQENNRHCKLKLIDFDGSYPESAAPSSPEEITRDPAYFAPEVYGLFMGFPVHIDHRLDIYALGLIFYYFWCGHLPEKPADQTVGEFIFSGGHLKVDPDVPPELAKLVNAMTSGNPDARPTLKEVYKTLEEMVTRYPADVIRIEEIKEPIHENEEKTINIYVLSRGDDGKRLGKRSFKIDCGKYKTVKAESFIGYRVKDTGERSFYVSSNGTLVATDGELIMDSTIIFEYEKERDKTHLFYRVLGILAALLILWAILIVLASDAFQREDYESAKMFMDVTPFYALIYSDTYQEVENKLSVKPRKQDDKQPASTWGDDSTGLFAKFQKLSEKGDDVAALQIYYVDFNENTGDIIVKIKNSDKNSVKSITFELEQCNENKVSIGSFFGDRNVRSDDNYATIHTRELIIPSGEYADLHFSIKEGALLPFEENLSKRISWFADGRYARITFTSYTLWNDIVCETSQVTYCRFRK